MNELVAGEKRHICDINLRVHLHKKRWEHWLEGDAEISYRRHADFSHVELLSQDFYNNPQLPEKEVASILNDRLMGMLVHLGAVMRENFMKEVMQE